MSKPARLVSIAAAVWIALTPLTASAASALFHFDDFAYPGEYEGPEFDDPYTYAYGCDGKPYCTGREIVATNGDGDGSGPSHVSTLRNGIGMEISRYGFLMTLNYDVASGWADVGNDPQDFTLFLLDFDTPLRSFAADIERPRIVEPGYCDDECPPGVERDVTDLIQLYLWSGPGGTGDLVGQLTITPDDPLDVIGSIGRVSLTSDQPFLSVNFGKAVSDDPGCIVNETIPCGYTSPTDAPFYNGYVIGHILVSTVPEPSTALLLGLGLVGLGARCRTRQRSRITRLPNWIRIQ